MNNDERKETFEEFLKRREKMPLKERLQTLVERGILNEKGEVIVRMPIGPGPNHKPKKKRRRKPSSE